MADPYSLMHLPDLGSVPALWDSGRDDTLVCRQVRQETHDVKTFVFGGAEPRLWRYAPGQFITLELEIDNRTIHRCYTLSSSPTRPDAVSITVKRVPGGQVSNWLHDNVKPGSTLRVLGPAGEFSCFTQALPRREKYLFLSAGSGITPLMSMARAAHDLSLESDIAFVHSARSPRDIIFLHELELIARNLRHFRLGFVCEGLAGNPAWAGFNGFLNLAVLGNIAPDFLEREVFICGPAPYMAAVQAILQGAGFDMAHYSQESFSFETLSAAADAGSDVGLDTAGRHKVLFSRSGAEIVCAAEETILKAAAATGMRLPQSCAKGMCGTCKTKLISGKVDMHHAGGIRQREIDQGWILPCCSKPLSDVVLER